MSVEDGPIDLKHGVTHFTYDFPPGTEVVDPSGKEEHIHYPMPSNNPADPLNWSPRWKMMCIFAMNMYVFWVSFPYIGVTSMYEPLVEEMGFSQVSISAFVGWAGFMSGIGNFFWVPVACRYGRRPVLLVSLIGCTAASIWFGVTPHAYRSFLWARIILGFFMSPVECFAPMQIADLFFTAERSRMHAWFFVNLLVSTNVGGALSGAFADSKSGWRTYFYFNAAMLAATFVVMFFCMPETSFRRSAALARGVHEVSDESTDEDLDEKTGAAVVVDAEHATIALVGKGAPTPDGRWGLTSGFYPTYKPFAALIRVAKVALIGPVWISVGWFGATKGILVGQSYVAAQIWQAPPYNFSNAAVGMTNIPAIVGTITGCVFWGWFSDWDLARRTRNNGGIREPEMRLWCILPGVAIGSVGIVIYAVGAQRGWSWPIILIIGVPLNWFGLIAPLIVGLSYSIDSYNRLAAEIGLLLASFGNAWIFGIGYFANHLLGTRGYITGLMFLMIPVWGMTVITVVYLFLGKSARRLTSNHSLLR
ncbi:major facilitator superfamily domain-containing protein [Mycena maculata]|uniref:Major facilitator superfamily domain-containing protein n=1 Tax=Mycena maculata TaxID=230809 RepID=A0AAD7JD42_9AGAR|nr:major facilitator superfamily domain-containing protein [Mycena maculata]